MSKPHRPERTDLPRVEIVESVYAEWFANLSGIPGLEIHCDPDITWRVEPLGSAWDNCAVRARLSPQNAGQRLDEVLTRYRKNGRGAGFWVGPSAEPSILESLLKARGLRCRKYFPAMYCDPRTLPPDPQTQIPLRFSIVTDYTVFRQHAHPYLGRISTAIRRFRLERQQYLASRSPRKSWEFVALFGSVPVGICTLFVGTRCAGLFDVGVLESMRKQGIGCSLVLHSCRFAQEQGAEGIVLISTNMGNRVYERVGFRVVSKIGFWYSANP